MFSGNHSLTGIGEVLISDLLEFAGKAGDDSFFSSSSSALAEAAAISSGLTSSPRLIRAAISGVTRIRRTFV